ncbi:MAG TPA: bifunctional metallophosphatase/5'-nucleotidase [Crocinitomicaceae bacterium]|nr:bifunctional metallophosphatase/5'-nucleotidase [Crocinitomicaceae bacterium]
MKRRTFVRNSVVVSGGLLIAPSILAQSAKKPGSTKLTILHTNDTHSNIDPFPENHSKYPGKGGVARRFELIEKVRREEEHVLLLDAGDIFQGTPYFNKFGGVLEMKLMTEMGYDVATMGNHDFDGGLEGFVKAREFAKFPFVCSNYNFTNTPIDGHTQDYTIIQKGKIKVGIFGVGVEMKGLVPGIKYGETEYIYPIDVANDRASELKRKGCDLIICLSHLGYEYGSEKVSDRVLARKTQNIHLIIGGHTHTFLDKPTEEKNLNGDTVLVNQVGWAGINVGRIDFEFDQKMFAKKDVIVVE